MTEKIIIDGVNVAGCQHLKECKDRKNPRCLLFDEKCHRIGFDDSYEDICYYKQLQRLKQENEELGRKAFFAEQMARTTAATFCDKDKQINELQQVLEEIREIVNEPCIEDEDCETCDSNCMSKEIKAKINECIGG